MYFRCNCTRHKGDSLILFPDSAQSGIWAQKLAINENYKVYCEELGPKAYCCKWLHLVTSSTQIVLPKRCDNNHVGSGCLMWLIHVLGVHFFLFKVILLWKIIMDMLDQVCALYCSKYECLKFIYFLKTLLWILNMFKLALYSFAVFEIISYDMLNCPFNIILQKFSRSFTKI